MVCETKILAEEREAAPGGGQQKKKPPAPQPRPLPAAPRWPPGPSPADGGAAAQEGVCIREFHPAQREVVRRIFYEGIMERIPNTAFRGLKDQPLTQLAYGAMAGKWGSPLLCGSRRREAWRGRREPAGIPPPAGLSPGLWGPFPASPAPGNACGERPSGATHSSHSRPSRSSGPFGAAPRGRALRTCLRPRGWEAPACMRSLAGVKGTGEAMLDQASAVP